MIRHIDLQLFNYCNRSCWFCPPQCQYKESEIKYMDDKTFSNTILLIKSLNVYDKVNICLNRYCEPFYDIERIVKGASDLKKILPNSRIIVQTNGDLMTQLNVVTAIASVIDEIRINLYDLDITQTIEFLISKFGYDITKFIKPIRGENKQLYFKRHNIDFYVLFNKIDTMEITNRGNTIKGFKCEERTTRCMIPRYILPVDYDGTIMPCCDTYGKTDKHSEMIIGNVNCDTPHDIQNRLLLFNSHEHESCRMCNAPFKKIFAVEGPGDFNKSI